MNIRKEIDREAQKIYYNAHCDITSPSAIFNCGALYGYKLACELLKSEEALKMFRDEERSDNTLLPGFYSEWLLRQLEGEK